VREYLDIREINGYSIQFTPFHPTPTPLTSISSPPTSPAASSTNVTTSQQLAERSILATTSISSRIAKNSGETITCLVYIGLPENPQFLGPQDPEELAKHILKSKGPSGENKEYLYALEKSLLELSEGSGDEHVGDLVRRCREIEGAEEWGENGDGDDGDEEDEEESHVGERLHRVGSTEEQEEIEKN
jgi:cation transport protein ChaC